MTSIAKEIKLGEVDSSKPTQVSTRDMAAQAGAAVRKFFSDHGVKLLTSRQRISLEGEVSEIHLRQIPR